MHGVIKCANTSGSLSAINSYTPQCCIKREITVIPPNVSTGECTWCDEGKRSLWNAAYTKIQPYTHNYTRIEGGHCNAKMQSTLTHHTFTQKGRLQWCHLVKCTCGVTIKEGGDCTWYAMLINCNEHAIKSAITLHTMQREVKVTCPQEVIKCTQEGRPLWCHVKKSAIKYCTHIKGGYSDITKLDFLHAYAILWQRVCIDHARSA